MGRVFMAAHLALPRPDDPLLSGWNAVVRKGLAVVDVGDHRRVNADGLALLARVDETAGPNYQPASRLHG